MEKLDLSVKVLNVVSMFIPEQNYEERARMRDAIYWVLDAVVADALASQAAAHAADKQKAVEEAKRGAEIRRTTQVSLMNDETIATQKRHNEEVLRLQADCHNLSTQLAAERLRGEQAVKDAVERETRGWRNSTAYAEQCEIHKLDMQKAVEEAVMKDRIGWDEELERQLAAERLRGEQVVAAEKARHKAELKKAIDDTTAGGLLAVDQIVARHEAALTKAREQQRAAYEGKDGEIAKEVRLERKACAEIAEKCAAANVERGNFIRCDGCTEVANAIRQRSKPDDRVLADDPPAGQRPLPPGCHPEDCVWTGPAIGHGIRCQRIEQPTPPKRHDVGYPVEPHETPSVMDNGGCVEQVSDKEPIDAEKILWFTNALLRYGCIRWEGNLDAFLVDGGHGFAFETVIAGLAAIETTRFPVPFVVGHFSGSFR